MGSDRQAKNYGRSSINYKPVVAQERTAEDGILLFDLQ